MSHPSALAALLAACCSPSLAPHSAVDSVDLAPRLERVSVGVKSYGDGHDLS